MSAPLVALHGVSKTFDNGVEALAPVDLAMNEGEFLSLVGPSGCGKSTALRLIAGLVRPTQGDIEFPGGRPEMGFVFQEPTLMPWATAFENARLPLDLKHVPRSEANARAAAALAETGLAEFEHAYPRELSGGMKMRVSIARAFVSAPTLLLMDEPFAALDEMTRQELNDDFIRLWQASGRRLTVVFVTHSVAEAAYLSTRVAVMSPRPGRIVADIPVSRARVPDAAYRFTPEFVENAKRISNALHGAMKVAA